MAKVKVKVKVKVYRTKIPLPIYGYTVHLIYTDNLEEAFKQEMVNDKLTITWLPGEGTAGFLSLIHISSVR